jgi:hypothetical protein
LAVAMANPSPAQQKACELDPLFRAWLMLACALRARGPWSRRRRSVGRAAVLRDKINGQVDVAISADAGSQTDCGLP